MYIPLKFYINRNCTHTKVNSYKSPDMQFNTHQIFNLIGKIHTSTCLADEYLSEMG